MVVVVDRGNRHHQMTDPERPARPRNADIPAGTVSPQDLTEETEMTQLPAGTVVQRRSDLVVGLPLMILHKDRRVRHDAVHTDAHDIPCPPQDGFERGHGALRDLADLARLLVEHLFDVVLISTAALHLLLLLPTLALPAVVLGHGLMGLVGDNARLIVAKGIIIISGSSSIITSTTLALGLDALLGILGLLLLVHAEPNPGRPRQRLAEPALGRS